MKKKSVHLLCNSAYDYLFPEAVFTNIKKLYKYVTENNLDVDSYNVINLEVDPLQQQPSSAVKESFAVKGALKIRKTT